MACHASGGLKPVTTATRPGILHGSSCGTVAGRPAEAVALGPCREISRGRGLQRAQSSTEARWAEGLQARQRGTAAGQNGVRGRSPGGLWELSPGGKFPAGGMTRKRSSARGAWKRHKAWARGRHDKKTIFCQGNAEDAPGPPGPAPPPAGQENAPPPGQRERSAQFIGKWPQKIPLPSELPQIMRTAQKAPWQENIEFQAERRRASGASPVFSWMRSWL